MVAPRLAAIGHVHLAAAMATPQKAWEKLLSVARRASGGGAAFASRIVGNQALVPLDCPR